MGIRTDKQIIMDKLYELIEEVNDFLPGDKISIWEIQMIMQDIQELNKKGEQHE